MLQADPMSARAVYFDASEPKDVEGYGVYGGFQFDPNFGTEMEYSKSRSKSFTTQESVTNPRPANQAPATQNTDINNTYDVNTYGIYGTYTHPFVSTNFYAKGRLGLAHVDKQKQTSYTLQEKIGEVPASTNAQATPAPINPTAPDTSTQDVIEAVTHKQETAHKETGVVAGLSLGYELGNTGAIELGYTHYSSDVQTIGLGAHLKF